MMLCPGVSKDEGVRKSPTVYGSMGLPTTLSSCCEILGLMNLQSNAVQPHFNFCELISILKAPLEYIAFRKCLGWVLLACKSPVKLKGNVSAKPEEYLSG